MCVPGQEPAADGHLGQEVWSFKLGELCKEGGICLCGKRSMHSFRLYEYELPINILKCSLWVGVIVCNLTKELKNSSGRSSASFDHLIKALGKGRVNVDINRPFGKMKAYQFHTALYLTSTFNSMLRRPERRVATPVTSRLASDGLDFMTVLVVASVGFSI